MRKGAFVFLLLLANLLYGDTIRFLGPRAVSVWDIALDRKNPGIWYVVTNNDRRFNRTSDNGRSWTPTPVSKSAVVVVHPRTSAVYVTDSDGKLRTSTTSWVP